MFLRLSSATSPCLLLSEGLDSVGVRAISLLIRAEYIHTTTIANTRAQIQRAKNMGSMVSPNAGRLELESERLLQKVHVMYSELEP